MPDILILHLNDVSDALITTSLIKKLIKLGNSVYCVTNDFNERLFEFSGGRNISTNTAMNRRFDVAINLSPAFMCADIIDKVKATKKLGYGVKAEEIIFYNEGAKNHYDIVHLNRQTNSSLFQIIFGIADISWEGEGYGLQYFPRNRSNRGLTGLAIKNAQLNKLILDNLELKKSHLINIPIKKNVFKQFDEVNRCKQVVTDDLTSFHVALALRKNVEYIIVKNPHYRIETFGCGNIHIFDQKGNSDN